MPLAAKYRTNSEPLYAKPTPLQILLSVCKREKVDTSSKFKSHHASGGNFAYLSRNLYDFANWELTIQIYH